VDEPVDQTRAIAGLSSVILVMLLGQSRVFYSMARDGLLPPFVSQVHPRFRTPWIGSNPNWTGRGVFSALFTVREAAASARSALLAFVIVSVGSSCCAFASRTCRADSRRLLCGSSPCRSCLGHSVDGRAALVNLAPAHYLVRRRNCCVFLLWRSPEQTCATFSLERRAAACQVTGRPSLVHSWTKHAPARWK
jgi:hypothetical protein